MAAAGVRPVRLLLLGNADSAGAEPLRDQPLSGAGQGHHDHLSYGRGPDHIYGGTTSGIQSQQLEYQKD